MKGSVSLNPKYSTLNIKPTKVLKTSPLIACDEKHLYFQSTSKDSILKSIRWEDKPIVNCAYLKKYQIILLLCENYRVYALTENLEEITSLTGWQSKHTLAFEYIDQYNILLMIGAQSIQILRATIETNIKKTKFLSSMKFNLKKPSPQPISISTNLPWNKGCGLNITENLLYVWSPDSIAFLQLSTHQLLSESTSLTKKESPITSCYFSPYFKYTVTGTFSGEIRVWRLPLSKKFHHQNVLIHTFQVHTKGVKQIIQSKYNQKVILTSGEDMLLCVWSLQTFESLRKFQFFGIYSQICVKSIHSAFVFKDNILGELNFGQSLQFITQVNSPIIQLDKQLQRIQNNNLQLIQSSSLSPKLSSTITLTLQQNLGLIFDKRLLLQARQLNKMQVKYIYPPLKAKSIKQIVSSPFTHSIYYLLAENGEIFKVVVPPFGKDYIGVSSKIENVYNIQFALDKEKHPLNQSPTIISFLEILPPEFDSEILEVEDGNKRGKDNGEGKKIGVGEAVQRYHEMKLITVGCQKGTIIFLNCSQMNKIYCRLTYHRQRILMIQSIKHYKTPQFNPLNAMLASYCSQNYLKLITFDYQKSTANCILTYYTGQQIKMIRGFDNFLGVVFYKGQFEIAEVDVKGKAEEFCCRRANVVENHQGEILSIDYDGEMEIVLTAATDNKIKIWTTRKILLYDVVMDDGLTSAFFVKHQLMMNEVKSNQQKQIQQGKTPTTNQGEKATNEKSTKQKISHHHQSSTPQPHQLLTRPKPIPVNFDIIILHGNKLLYFHHIPLSFKPNQIQSFNENTELIDDHKITLRQVFESYSQRTIQHKQVIKSQPPLLIVQNKEIIKPSRQRIKTQPSQNVNKKTLFEDHMQMSQQSLSPIKKSRLKNQLSTTFQNQKSDKQEPAYFSQKKKQKKPSVSKGQPSISTIKQVLYRPGLVSQSSIDATRRHINQLQSLKKEINYNRPFLPKINKKEDVFDQFMKEKFMNKNVLTRRDITINRIIMKNMIREHFVDESKMGGLRLDY